MTKAKSNQLKFKAKLVSRGPGGAWTYLQVPFSVPEVFGKKGQIPVRATINGFTFRNSLMPRQGVHILGAGKDALAAAAASPGDTVEVSWRLTMRRAPSPFPPTSRLRWHTLLPRPSHLPAFLTRTKKNMSIGSRVQRSQRRAPTASRKRWQ
jgi:hypothetical protein